MADVREEGSRILQPRMAYRAPIRINRRLIRRRGTNWKSLDAKEGDIAGRRGILCQTDHERIVSIQMQLGLRRTDPLADQHSRSVQLPVTIKLIPKQV